MAQDVVINLAYGLMSGVSLLYQALSMTNKIDSKIAWPYLYVVEHFKLLVVML